MTRDQAEAAVRLRRELRTRLRQGAETIELTAADANLLLEEIGRLHQANDRLRRQNRRVRKRLQGKGGEVGVEDVADDGGTGPHIADDDDVGDGGGGGDGGDD